MKKKTNHILSWKMSEQDISAIFAPLTKKKKINQKIHQIQPFPEKSFCFDEIAFSDKQNI